MLFFERDKTCFTIAASITKRNHAKINYLLEQNLPPGGNVRASSGKSNGGVHRKFSVSSQARIPPRRLKTASRPSARNRAAPRRERTPV